MGLFRRRNAVQNEKHATGTEPQQEFNHDVAQRYEIREGNAWLDQNIASVVDRRACFLSNLDEVPPLYERFLNKERWRRLREHTAGRSLLEIGSGPIPEVTLWSWGGETYIIDPLAAEYDLHARERHGVSFFEGVAKVYSLNAESFVEELAGKIDGAIYCRNCLDHCPDPFIILANIAAYAAPGCFLTLWTDLYHLDGHDEGHTNITKDVAGFGRLIRQLGFNVEYEGEPYPDRAAIQYSCFAVKRS